MSSGSTFNWAFFVLPSSRVSVTRSLCHTLLAIGMSLKREINGGTGSMSWRLCNRLNELFGVLESTVTSDARKIVVGVVAPLVLHLSPTQSEIATIRGFAGEPRGKYSMYFSVVYVMSVNRRFPMVVQRNRIPETKPVKLCNRSNISNILILIISKIFFSPLDLSFSNQFEVTERQT